MKNKIKIRYRLGKSIFFKGVTTLLAFIIIIPLLSIIIYIARKGIGEINWHFFTQIPLPVGETGGGVANAIIGSLIIVGVAALIAIPLGIMSGIYLSEHPASRLAYFSRLCVDILQGVPSIVVGIIAYFWLVKPMETFSAVSGSAALAIMMLPIIIRSTEETLRLVPFSLKEAAYALGVPYHRVILKVVLPNGFTGVLSGVMLAVARVAGETAPLLFTAFGNPYINTDIRKPMQSLPLIIYNYAISPYISWQNLAWGASLILLIWILLLNIITKLIAKRWNVPH